MRDGNKFVPERRVAIESRRVRSAGQSKSSDIQYVLPDAVPACSGVTDVCDAKSGHAAS